MIKSTLIEALNGVWPMIAIFTVILASFRITYLIYKKEKFVLYKELSSLIFLIYILVLFYLVTYQESNYGISNYTPFKEIFRYNFGSALFFRNIIGNILLFLPLGLFLTSYINTKKLLPIFLLTAICSFAIELTQKNIIHNKIKNVILIKSDLFQNLENLQFDIVVSNPPYIDENNLNKLDLSVKNWEDHNALVCKNKGLDIINKIIDRSDNFLLNNIELEKLNIPQLVLEIDYTQAKIIENYFNFIYIA
jgi:hypothetical protein